jgi:hypothetical protein
MRTNTPTVPFQEELTKNQKVFFYERFDDDDPMARRTLPFPLTPKSHLQPVTDRYPLSCFEPCTRCPIPQTLNPTPCHFPTFHGGLVKSVAAKKKRRRRYDSTK